MLRTSERGTFKMCRWKWWMEFEEFTKPKQTGKALRFGSLIHGALAAYYVPGRKRGVLPWITFEQLYEEQLRELEGFGYKLEDDDKWTGADELGDAMLHHYIDHYGADDEWEVLVTEQPFRVLVYRPESYDPNYPANVQQNAEPWFWYTGILDGIWRNLRTKKLHIVDHKTALSILLKYLSMDDQATAYWTWGLDWIYEKGLLKPNQKPAGMLFNILRKALPDERPMDEQGNRLNNDGSISKRQPSPYFARVPIYRAFNERESARERSLVEFANMEAIRATGERDGTSGPPPDAYKNPGQFTCPSCWLFDICELHEIGQDWRELREMTTKQWQPYAEHETYAAETR